MKITKEEMKEYGHQDDWGVECLYLEAAQRLFDAKIDKLLADRKALLKALHAFVDQTLVLPSGESVWGEELINARAAIAQAEKEG